MLLRLARCRYALVGEAAVAVSQLQSSVQSLNRRNRIAPAHFETRCADSAYLATLQVLHEVGVHVRQEDVEVERVDVRLESIQKVLAFARRLVVSLKIFQYYVDCKSCATVRAYLHTRLR